MRDAGFRLLQLLYFMLPAYAANMAPPFLRYWHGWNRPIHEHLLGAHKTVLGFALGVGVALLLTAIQAAVATPLALVGYAHWPLLGLGFGAGAMLGDSIKSLVKRRIGIAPGARWFPFDQLDFAIGALVFVGAPARLSWLDVAVILAVSLAGDLVVNRVAFLLHIKDAPW